MTPAPPRPWRAVLGLASALATLLAIARSIALLWIDSALREVDPELARWRIGEEAFRIAAHGFAAALAAAVVLVPLADGLRARRRSARRLLPLALLLAAAAIASALSGWPLDDPLHVPGFATERGRRSWLLIAAAALVAAALTLAAARLWRARPRPRLGRLLGGATWLAFLATPLVSHAWWTRTPPTRTVREVVREVALEPDAYEVVRSPAERGEEGEVRAGVLTPSLDFRVDGGDLPALVMPPPSEVRFVVPDVEGPLHLSAAAGVDRLAREALTRKVPMVGVEFEITVDGERVLHHTQVVRRGKPRDPKPGRGQLVWKRIPPPGLRVRPGQEVVLRTDLKLPDGLTAADLPPLPAGFGDLVLTREFERPRLPSSPDTPSILLVVMDTLRADRLSCYGAEPRLTPHLDDLAGRGLLFEEAFSTASWTWPATASILTGLGPESHGVLADGSCYLDGRLDTLAEVLSRRGYTTGAFTCNPLIVPNKNFDQGFDLFDSFRDFRNSHLVIEDVERWLERHQGERFFLYLHLVDTHWKYEPTEEERELAGVPAEPPEGYPEQGVAGYHRLLLRILRNRDSMDFAERIPPAHVDYMRRSYDAAVASADRYVGRVLDRLADLGIDDRTVVCFTSDHGEELLDHGLAAHGSQIHRELVHVPLILAGPGVPRGRVSRLVSSRWIAPTLARYANAELPLGEEPVILVEPQRIPARTIFFSTYQGFWKGLPRTRIFGLSDADWTLFWAPDGRDWGADPETTDPGDFALFDRRTDLAEHHDLSRERPEVVERLHARLLAELERQRALGRTVQLGVGGQAAQGLIDIGYAGEEDDVGAAVERDLGAGGPGEDGAPASEGGGEDGRTPRSPGSDGPEDGGS